MDTPRHQFTFDEQIYRQNMITNIQMQAKAYGMQAETHSNLDKLSNAELEERTEGMRQIYNASLTEKKVQAQP